MDVEKNAWISAMLTCWFQSLGMQKGRGNFADCKSLLQSLHHWMASSRTSWSISNSTPTRSQTSCYECLCVSWLFAHACFLMKTSCTLLWLLLAKFTFVSWVYFQTFPPGLLWRGGLDSSNDVHGFCSYTAMHACAIKSCNETRLDQFHHKN